MKRKHLKYSDMEKFISGKTKWILPAGVILCGTFLAKDAYDQALTSRHLIWCVLTIVLIASAKKVRVGNIHLLFCCYLFCALMSGLFAINISEWLACVLRILLMLIYLTVVDIDRKMLSKTMIILGCIFALYFWYDYSSAGRFLSCRGLTRNRNSWSAAQFFVIPFCFYAVKEKFWVKPAVAISTLMAMNIGLLWCKSAILATLVSGLIILTMNKKLRWYVIASSTIIGCVLFAGLCKSNSWHLRIEQWRPTVKMAAYNPFGVGAGNWWIEFPDYARGIEYPNANETNFFRFPHNDYLWVFAETGYAGGLCYLSIFGLALYYTVKKKELFLVIGLVGYMIIAFFSMPRERPFATLILMTLCAMVPTGKCVIRHARFGFFLLMISVTVVFGFRHKAMCRNKLLREGKLSAAQIEDSHHMFSTVTYCSYPWKWWSGREHRFLGDHEKACELFAEAYKYNPNNVEVLNSMGIVYGRENNNLVAKMFFEKAHAISPNHKDPILNLKVLNGN